MNFEYESTFLVVDPKGFPFRELPLESSGLYAKPTNHLTETEIFQFAKKKLLSNWTIYSPREAVELDFSIGMLVKILDDAANKYASTVQSHCLQSIEDIGKMEDTLIQYVTVLLEAIKKVKFYEFSLNLVKMFRKQATLFQLYFYSDNFTLLRIVSDIETLILSKIQQVISLDDATQRASYTEEVTDALEKMEQLADLYDDTKIEQYAKNNELLQKARKNMGWPSHYHMGEFDMRKHIDLSIGRRWANKKQISDLIEMAKNFHKDSVDSPFWSSINIQSIQIMKDCTENSLTIRMTSLSENTLKDLLALIKAKTLSDNTFFESCLAFLKQSAEKSEVIELGLNKIKQIIYKSKKPKAMFDFLNGYVPRPPQELINHYVLIIDGLLDIGNDCQNVDIYNVEFEITSFLKYHKSALTVEGDYLLSTRMLDRIKKKLYKSIINPKEQRLAHFIFNQLMYTSLDSEQFEQYFKKTLSDPPNLKIFTSILKKLTQNNQLIFKHNFRFLHAFVHDIYAKQKETSLENLEIVKLYWEMAAKFLMMWGKKSFLQEDIDSLRDHYDILLAKIMDALTIVNRAHENQENQLKNYFHSKSKYNTYYVECWLSFLSYKHHELVRNLLHIMLFLREQLPQSQLKILIKLLANTYSPLVNMKVCHQQEGESINPFVEDIDTLTNEYIIQLIEIIHCFFVDECKLDLSWANQTKEQFWVSLWHKDTIVQYLNDKVLTSGKYESLIKLRKVEFYVSIFNIIMEKLSETSKNSLYVLRQIEEMAITVCSSLWTTLSPVFSKEIIGFFYQKSEQLSQLSDQEMESPRFLQMHQFYCSILSSNPNYVSFQKQNILERFRILEISNKLFNSIWQTNQARYTQIVKMKINTMNHVSRHEYKEKQRVIAYIIRMINTLEGYFNCSNSLQKKVKCQEFIPLKTEALASMNKTLSHLADESAAYNRDPIVIPLSELFIRQVKKYFVAYLLQQLIDINKTDEEFTNLLNLHMNIHRKILKFITAIGGPFEQIHCIFVQILQNAANKAQKKARLEKIILQVFNLFIYSTFELQSRVRSALFSQLVLSYEKLTKIPKKSFNKTILHYLQQNFNAFIPYRLTEELSQLDEGDIAEIDKIKINSNDKKPIKIVCCQAMIINLLSRNNYPSLTNGIMNMFSSRQGVQQYLEYLVRVAQHLSRIEQIEEQDQETLILDVFGALDSILGKGTPKMNDLSGIIDQLVMISQSLHEMKKPIIEVNNCVNHHLINRLFDNPSHHCLEKYKVGANHWLRQISLEQSLASQCRSSLHLLNCFYLDPTCHRVIKENWHKIVQNFDQKAIKSVSLELSLENRSIFLADYSTTTPQVPLLIKQFSNLFEMLLTSSQPSIPQKLLNVFRIIISLALKFPSLINQICSTPVEQSDFQQYILQKVLQYNIIIPLQFIILILKTNSGFSITEQNELIPNSYIKIAKIKQTLLEQITNSSNSILVANSSKALEYIIKNQQHMLLTLYRKKQFQLPQFDQPNLSFNCTVIKQLLKSPLRATVIPLLNEAIKSLIPQQFFKQNIIYHNNTKQAKPTKWKEYNKKLVFLESDRVPCRPFGECSNRFSSRLYCLTTQQEEQSLRLHAEAVLKMLGSKQAQQMKIINDKINKVSENVLRIDEKSEFAQGFDIMCTKEQPLEKSTEMSQSDHFLEDDIIEEDALEGGLGQDGIVGDTSFEQQDLIENQNGHHVIFRRVQKLQLMQDLQVGLNIQDKIQFLSNDQLLAMISVSDGRLRLALQEERKSRGLCKKPSKSPEDIRVRYLDELYPCCRINKVATDMVNNSETVVPTMSQEVLKTIINILVNCPESCLQTVQELIENICLNSHNLGVIIQFLYCLLSLTPKEQDVICQMKELFEFPQLTKTTEKQMKYKNYKQLHGRVLKVISRLFSINIGLTVWLQGKFNKITYKMDMLRQVEILEHFGDTIRKQLPQRGFKQYELIDLVAAYCTNYSSVDIQSIVMQFKEYVQKSERYSSEGYPYYIIDEKEDVDQGLIISFTKNLDFSNVIHIELLKVLLQKYPTCYETFIFEFLKTFTESIRAILDEDIKNFKKFQNAYSLRVEAIIEMSKDTEKLEKLVDSYFLFMKNAVTDEEKLQRLYKQMEVLCFDVVSWFKEWRFQVENRVESGQYKEKANNERKKMQSLRKQHKFEEAEQVQYRLEDEEVEFKRYKTAKINEFSNEYLKSVHDSSSIGLVSCFVKAQQIIEVMKTCFKIPNDQVQARPANPNDKTLLGFKFPTDKIPTILPIFRNISYVWKMAVAFGSLYLEDEVSCGHTMSALQTKEQIKSKVEANSSKSNVGNSGRRRSSVKLSIKVGSLFSMDKVRQRQLNSLSLMSQLTEPGQQICGLLARFGGLQAKLKSLRRKKSGLVKEVEIERNRVWFDTILAIDQDFTNKDIRIKFKGELGIDYGGLTKEWLTLITKQLFNPNFGLFELSANRLTIQPSKLSCLVPNHLMHFRKLGVLVGKALIEGWNLQINFTKSFLKHLLGNPIYVQDLQDIDPETCNSLMWILNNHVDESLQLTFVVDVDEIGVTKQIQLMKNGENIYVNDSNKKQYVKAICRMKMTDLIRPQSKAFMQGLQSVVPYNTLKYMDYRELGLYLCGMPVIDVQQMRRQARYHNCSKNDKVVEWFWMTLQEFNSQILANFLFFLTGSFKVPYGGFKQSPITINRSGQKDHLPVAHTCFNTLDLPDYSDKKTLAQKLLISINEGHGFNIS